GGLTAVDGDRQYKTESDGDCKLTLEGDKDNKLLTASGSCSKKLGMLTPGEKGAAELKDISFTCEAPEDIEWDRIGKGNGDGGSDSNGGDDSNGGGDSNAGGDSN